MVNISVNRLADIEYCIMVNYNDNDYGYVMVEKSRQNRKVDGRCLGQLWG